jgi:hypothetical protein
MSDKQTITINSLNGIYKDIAEIIGIEKTILLHDNFQGQQISFPKKLYTKEYIIQQVKNEDNENLKTMAFKYGYTERHLRRILKETT